jgi:hypothetical protein
VSQADARHKSAPSYTMRGGPFRETALSYTSTGPGPVYNPPIRSSGLGGAFTKGNRSEVGEGGGTASTPGPKYYTRKSLDGPSATFSRAKRAPDQPGASPFEAGAVDPVLAAPKGFGFGCSVEEHLKYGQCLDGLCCTRGTWEVAARRKAKLHAKAALKRSATADTVTFTANKPGTAGTGVSFAPSAKSCDLTALDTASEGGSSWASEEALPDEFSLSGGGPSLCFVVIVCHGCVTVFWKQPSCQRPWHQQALLASKRASARRVWANKWAKSVSHPF